MIREFNECHNLKDRSVVREKIVFVKHEVFFVYCILLKYGSKVYRKRQISGSLVNPCKMMRFPKS